MDTRVLTKHVSGAAFSFYSADEVRALSVKRVTNALAFDQLKQPVPSGLYDPALGPVDKFGRCARVCICSLDHHWSFWILCIACPRSYI